MPSRRRFVVSTLAFVACTTPQAEVEVHRPSLTAAQAPSTPVALPLALADQLALVPEPGEYIMIRDAQALVDAGIPWRAMVTPTAPHEQNERAQLLMGLRALEKLHEGEDPPLRRAGVDLRGGLVLWGTKPAPELIFAAQKPDIAAVLLMTLPFTDSNRTTCAAFAPSPFVACGPDTPPDMTGRRGDGAERLRAWQRALPGVDLEAMHLFFAHQRENIHGAARMEPGRIEAHVTAPQPDLDDMATLLVGGAPTLLRFAQPGVSFAWARGDTKAVRTALAELIDPAPFAHFLAAWSGEVLISGSVEPAGMHMFIGLDELAPAHTRFRKFAARWAAELKGTTKVRKLGIQLDSPKLRFDGASTPTLRLRASSSAELDTIARALGLSWTLGAFTTERSLAVVVGHDFVEASPPPSHDAVLQTLPAAAADDLRAGTALALVFITFDATQSLATQATLDALAPFAAAGKIADTRVDLSKMALLSSMTLWMTRPEGHPVWHMVIDLIGHTADPEGRAALAATEAVPPERERAFAQLVETYPSSPRRSSYRVRAGELGKGALAGSIVPLLLALGALYVDPTADEDTQPEDPEDEPSSDAPRWQPRSRRR